MAQSILSRGCSSITMISIPDLYFFQKFCWWLFIQPIELSTSRRKPLSSVRTIAVTPNSFFTNDLIHHIIPDMVCIITNGVQSVQGNGLQRKIVIYVVGFIFPTILHLHTLWTFWTITQYLSTITASFEEDRRSQGQDVQIHLQFIVKLRPFLGVQQEPSP